MTFTDITIYERIKLAEAENKLHATLNTSVHHEMVTPLNINVDVAQNIMEKLENQELKDLVEMIMINSKLIRFYANDLLDHQIL